MKLTYPFASAAIILLTQTSVVAAGKTSLLKALVQDPKVSRLSLKSLDEMNAAIQAAGKGKYFWSHNRRGVLEESNNGLTGRVHSLTSNEDKSLTSTVFRVPEASVKPVSTEVTASSEGVFVSRQYQTAQSEVSIIDNFSVEHIHSAPMRVKHSAIMNLGDKGAILNLGEEGLTISKFQGSKDIWWQGARGAKGVLPIDEKSGKLISFNLDLNKNRLTVQVAEGPDKITERYYDLAEEVQSGEADRIIFKDAGFKPLSPEEIQKAGFLAYSKTLKSAVSAGSNAATRGAKVNVAR